MFSTSFWRAAAERAIKSGAQFVLLTIGTGALVGGLDSTESQVINAFLLDFPTLGGVFLGGALLSALTSLVTAKVTDGNPSAVKAEVLSPPAPYVSPDGDADRVPGPDHSL